MYDSFMESLREHIKDINFENIKDFFIEFGNKLHSSDNLASLICLICIDIFAILLLLKANKEKRFVISRKSNIIPQYGFIIGDRQIKFKSNEILIGRHTSCDIRCLNSTVSRYHAIVFLKDGCWYIKDINSTYGTFKNDTPINDITPITQGDDIRLGEQHFTVEIIPNDI